MKKQVCLSQIELNNFFLHKHAQTLLSVYQILTYTMPTDK